MKNIARLLSVILTGFAALASAQDQFIEMKLKSQSQATVAPNATTKEIKFAYFSTDPYVSTLNMDIVAPGKTVISAKALGVPTNYTIEQALAAFKSAYTIKVSLSGSSFKDSVQFGATGSSGGNGDSQRYCNGHLSKAEYDYFLALYMELSGGVPPASEDEFCTIFVGEDWDQGMNGGGNGGADLTGALVTTHVLKDMCSRSSSKYLVVVTLNTSKLSAADKAAGYTVAITPTESEYRGGKAQKVKARGDGMYKSTLFIDEQMGADKILAVEFAAGKIKKLRVQNDVPVKKALYYKGKVLVVGVPSSKVLTGRNGTIFDYNTAAIYGTCFNLSARDQEKNGYP